MEDRRADVIYRRINTLTCGHVADLLGKILTSPGLNNLSTQLFQDLYLGRTARDCEHPRATGQGNLHTMHTETATSTGHQYSLASPNPPDIPDRIQLAAHGAGNNAGLLRDE